MIDVTVPCGLIFQIFKILSYLYSDFHFLVPFINVRDQDSSFPTGPMFDNNKSCCTLILGNKNVILYSLVLRSTI